MRILVADVLRPDRRTRQRQKDGKDPAHGGVDYLWFRNAEVFADLGDQLVVDLGVSGNGGATVLTRIVPPRVAGSFAEKFATMFT